MELGYVAATPNGRVLLPDFEVDLGLLPNFELDLDGVYAFDPSSGGDSLPDNLWLSGKIGVFALHWGADLGLSGGLQLGPRFPLAHGASSIGVDALALVGLAFPRTKLVLNVGGYVDPAQAIPGGADTQRPIGVQLGLDVDVDLTRDGRWSLHGAFGSVIALAVDPTQVTLALGVVLSPTPSLDLSILGLVGLLPGGDRAGAMAGVSPKYRLWH